MNHKEQVEKKIRELVPELNSSSGICECGHPRFRHNGHLGTKYTQGGTEWHYDECHHCVCKEYGDSIGSPIELRHVLRAIQESARWVFLGVAEDKLFFSRRKLANGESIEEGEPISYNLTRPFTDQDPALYEFLHSILCGKE